MVNHSKSTESSSFDKDSHTTSNSLFKLNTSHSIENLSPPSPSAMAPKDVYTEDRNILVCGARGCGKTSLIFTISRGIFPGSFSPDITPGRFEGWSIGASAIPVSASSPTKSSSSSLSSNHHGGKEKNKPYNVSLTFWEDRPRLNLNDDCTSNSSEDEGNEENKSDSTGSSKIKNEVNGNNSKTNGSDNKDAKMVDGNPAPLISHTHVHHLYGQQKVHRLGRRRSSTKLLLKNKQQVEEPVVPFTSSDHDDRIWPIPEPHVIVVCYSSVDPTSFMEVGKEIIPELNKRFPNVPRILAATKDDLKSDVSGIRSVTNTLDETNINTKSECGAIKISSIDNGNSNSDCSFVKNVGSNTKTNDVGIVTTEMGCALKRKIGARAFIECSSKNQTHLRTIIEEAVLISFDNWLQRNSSSTKPSKLTGGSQKVERKWSLAAQLSSSFPMHSWSNLSNPKEKGDEDRSGLSSASSLKVSNQNTGKMCPSHVPYDKCSSLRMPIRSQSGDISPRPLITIQDPFSPQCFSGINSASSSSSLTSPFVGNRQRKQSYGRAAVRKIWHTYSGGGSTSSTTGNSISSSSSSSSSAASTVTSRKGLSH